MTSYLTQFGRSKNLCFFFQQQVQNFGEPFFLVVHEGETLAEVKLRIQKRLQVPDEEFAKVFSYLSLLFVSFFLFVLFPLNLPI